MATKTGDNTLALLAAKGERDAFRQLLERHYDMIFRVAYRFCGHREEAEDMAQDVCVSLPARLKSFRAESEFKTWLYRVVVNRVKDLKRSQARSDQLHKTYGEVEELRRGEALANAKELEWLEEMMKRLPEELRDTAILVVGEGMNHSDAAEVLGIKEGTVSWRMSELKKTLRVFAKEDA